MLLRNSPGHFLPSSQPQTCHPVHQFFAKVKCFLLSRLCKQREIDGETMCVILSGTIHVGINNCFSNGFFPHKELVNSWCFFLDPETSFIIAEFIKRYFTSLRYVHVSFIHFFSLIPPGFFSANHPSEAGIWQMWAPLQDPKEEPQQVPILPFPEVPVSGHVPQRWVLQGRAGLGSASSSAAHTHTHTSMVLVTSRYVLLNRVPQLCRCQEKLNRHVHT